MPEAGTVARLTGVGDRDSRRQVYTDVFTASCQANHRTFTKLTVSGSYFVPIPKQILSSFNPHLLVERLPVMTPTNLRQRARRQHERRIKERRAVQYRFGSPEWLSRVQQENLLYPKQDRRNSDRRSHERRKKHRRTTNAERKSAVNPTSPAQILTPEEKQMLNDLMRQNNN